MRKRELIKQVSLNRELIDLQKQILDQRSIIADCHEEMIRENKREIEKLKRQASV